MGLFSKPEVQILRESTAMKDYLAKLENLYLSKPSLDLEKEIKIVKAGIVGEDRILYELKNSGMDMIVLHDIYLECEEQSAQIDFLVITPKINIIIECKNLVGDIEINNNGDFIRTFEIRGKKIKEGIYSPITQNARHMLVLKNKKMQNQNVLMKAGIAMNFDRFHKSLVVLANPKTVLYDKYAKKEIKEQVIRADRLIDVIKKLNELSNEKKSNIKEMHAVGEKILEYHVDRDSYEEKYQRFLDGNEAGCDDEKLHEIKEEPLVCPQCGHELVVRVAKKGANVGKKFYGCSNFPKCKFVKDMN